MQEVLNAFGVDWRLLGIQILNFGILLGALWYFLYKPVLAMVRKREETIARGVALAREAEEEKRAFEKQKHSLLKEAEEEAHGIVTTAKKHGEEARVALLTEAGERAKRLEEDALLRARETAERAKREAEKEVARLAILAAEKVLRKG